MSQDTTLLYAVSRSSVLCASLPNYRDTCRLPGDTLPHPSAAQVFACVRLGRKCEFKELYERAMRCLRSYFPTNLTRWRQLSRYVPPQFTMIDAVGVVNIARLAPDLSILPTALFACCVSTRPEIVVGDAQLDQRHGRLSEEDVALCWKARTHLVAVTSSSPLVVVSPILPSDCESASLHGDPCKAAAPPFLQAVEKQIAKDENNPLQSVVSRFDEGLLQKLCPQCLTGLKGRSQKPARQNWNKLPSLLGLENLDVEWEKGDVWSPVVLLHANSDRF
ncbi:uncharacterized protein BXZ73DRAFT_100829 [Epithele typhae]|uniref:uncharacterized protein n=1 Tax=Epithele typhae TaxID=378194 RepID=UPI0020081C30|nr:uncharacterized protein BXZ73DRAFT_100829 [Epithele typhae]KAH9933991.1 hypothetical protein BXZ73DRAFT_100829 [Epithele typhae]